MSQLVTYLVFNGNCREAMAFYQFCLGGELRIQTVGDAPGAEGFPPAIKNFILQASLRKENMVLMGTDMAEENGLTQGNAISILLECDSEEEINTYYQRLASAGRPTHPIEETFWGALFGGLTDRYGKQWLFHCNK